jgi:hypothetical protein
VSAYCLTLTQQVYHGEKMLIFNEIMNLKKKKNLTQNLIIFLYIHFDPLYYEISKSHRNISPFSIKRNSIVNTKKTYSKLVEK